jgi:hypothetical protein
VVARVDSMAASGRRRVWSMLDRVLAELIWLNPASTVLFRSFAAEEAAEDDAEDVVSEARAA